ncbi:MAG: hypothetical protein HUK25_04205 [Treponema sp.]|nr:hypothetical protein [Treponema sp.]
MGLLSYIESGSEKIYSNTDISKKESLLERAMALSKGLSFFEFIKKYNLSHCAIFKKTGVKYSMHFSAGFDAETILESISTADFWNGTIENDKWFFYNKENNSINEILQLFSSELKEKISFAQIFKHENYILLIAQSDNDTSDYSLSDMALDFVDLNYSKENKIVFKNNSNYNFKICVDYSKALDKTVNSLIYKSEIINNIKSAFITEFIFHSAELIDTPNAFGTESEFKVKFGLITDSKISKNAFKSLISLSSKAVFGSKASYITYDN